MKRGKQFTLVVTTILGAFGVILGGVYLIRTQSKEKGAIVVPQLSREAKKGEIAFRNYCIACHGQSGTGTDMGPPLVHRIYGPSHHSYVSFVRAVTLGVPQHHWLFGKMPPLPQVERREVDLIIIYIRELQKANGTG